MLDEDFNAILHNFAFIWFSDSCFSLLNTRKPKDVGIFIEDRVKNYFFFFFSRERDFSTTYAENLHSSPSRSGGHQVATRSS